MTTTVDTLLDSRTLCLMPTVWRQWLLSGGPQQPPDEVRRLSFHAKADWPDRRNWFDDPVLSDILFEIDILSDTTASKRRREQSPEWEGTIGGLRYNGDPVTEERISSFVYGIFSVSDTVYEDLWERVKYRALLPRAISLQILGLQLGQRDYWDVKKQPKLKVLSAEIGFATDQSSSMLLPNHANPADAKNRRG